MRKIFFLLFCAILSVTWDACSFAKSTEEGFIISTGIIQIENRGNGNIGVYMQTMAHQAVDETKFGVHLDRFIESDQRWANVINYTFTYAKSQYPYEDLSMKSISFDIGGQPSSCYYRLRGQHWVKLGEACQSLNSQTDGLFITKTFE